MLPQSVYIYIYTPMATTAFLSRSPGLLNRGPGGPASLGAGFLICILYPTDWTSCALSYIIVHRPPSCGCHKSHSFNPSTVKVIFWYSSTGCTCYLHMCISYFDSPAGSEVSIQQEKSPLVLTTDSKWTSKSKQAFLTVSLFELVNATVILAFRSSSVLLGILVVSRSSAPYTL